MASFHLHGESEVFLYILCVVGFAAICACCAGCLPCGRGLKRLGSGIQQCFSRLRGRPSKDSETVAPVRDIQSEQRRVRSNSSEGTFRGNTGVSFEYGQDETRDSSRPRGPRSPAFSSNDLFSRSDTQKYIDECLLMQRTTNNPRLAVCYIPQTEHVSLPSHLTSPPLSPISPASPTTPFVFKLQTSEDLSATPMTPSMANLQSPTFATSTPRNLTTSTGLSLAAVPAVQREFVPVSVLQQLEQPSPGLARLGIRPLHESTVANATTATEDDSEPPTTPLLPRKKKSASADRDTSGREPRPQRPSEM